MRRVGLILMGRPLWTRFAELNVCSLRAPLDLRGIVRVWFKSLAHDSQKTLSDWSS